jgi:hypothetical protein
MRLHGVRLSFGRKVLLRSLAGAAAVYIGVAAVACSRVPPESPAPGPGAGVTRLRQDIALLERRLELANGKDFYLLLDPARPELTLMLRGATLRRFPILALQVGRPRIGWIGGRAPITWQGVIWSDGALDPPRAIDRVVVTAEPGSQGGAEAEPPPIPRTAEELYPVPSRYLVRFSNRLSVEIRPHEADAGTGRLARFGTWFRAQWGNAVAMASTNRDAVRLRVVLNPKDAESLYRSLPPGVRLLVLFGRPARTARPPD